MVELKTKTGLLIQIDKNSFEKAPDFLNHTKEILGKINNVRVEVKDNMESTGVIVTSESEIIHGSLKEQFITFDKLFSKFIPEEKQEEMDSLLNEGD